ncbi:MAG: 4-hydroxybenzoate octaprenyltransferase [Proteobacteria bacterium]|nr:4-hydroxybenzoate octaprenyltransferase [Pseudomonadota bacterium]
MKKSTIKYDIFLNYITPYIKLIRIHKPIPILLLAAPILWILAFTTTDLLTFISFAAFFLFGSFLTRSAGCIINDIIDKDIDTMVQRTKDRPIASGAISLKGAIALLVLLLLMSFFILITLPQSAFYFGFIGLFLMTFYPISKRFTYLPQIFLGFTYNIGIFIAWFTIEDSMEWQPIILYLASVAWTIGYDTIYAYQDYECDKAHNIKSLAVKLKEKGSLFIWKAYQFTAIMICICGIHYNMNYVFYLIIAFASYQLYSQSEKLDIHDKESCAKIFASNKSFALIVLTAILLGKI